MYVKALLVRICLLACALCSIGALPERALCADEPIYVVDIRRVIKESIMGKAALNNLEQEKKKKQLVIDKLKLDLAELDKSIANQSSLLSPRAMQEKQDQRDKKELEITRAFQDQETDFVKKKNAEIVQVIDQADLIVKELAKEKNTTFVFDYDPRVVVYASERLDLTDDVIKRLDKKKMG